MNNRELWQYYFGQLPCYAMSRRYRMPDLVALEQEPSYQAGAAYLRECLGGAFTIISDAEIARRASWVRLWRESDAYSALGLASHKLTPPVILEGSEHLIVAAALGRPLVLLTAHVGSFYLTFSTLAANGYHVYPVARSVDRSAATPRPVQWFLRLNYWASERKLNQGHYLYTDFSGKFDKRITKVLRQSNTLCVNLIDMPATLYGGKRHPVTFLGKPALLPVNFINWAQKKRAVFLTYWSGFESDFSDNCTPHRWVRIESLIETDSAEGVLQTYAERLSALITREPWQWMGLPIASQYHQTVQPSRL